MLSIDQTPYYLPVTTLQMRLRGLKSKSRATALEIALACGVSKQTVQAWLKGTMPKTMHLASLSAYFGVSQEWLLDGDDSEDRENIIEEIQQMVPGLSREQLAIIRATIRQFVKVRT